MLDDVEFDPAKRDVDTLFDAPDDELERAATVVGGQAVTVGVSCTFFMIAAGPCNRAMFYSWQLDENVDAPMMGDRRRFPLLGP